jgi:CBS domain-containing protein
MIAVNEIMSTARVTVGPTAFIGDLLALFDQNDFNAFPVLDERERLVGIVSKLDVLQLFLADHLSTPSGAEALGPARVADLMRHRIVSIDAHESIADAGALMVAMKLRSLPVVERRDGRVILVGILSRGDVLRALRFQLVEASYVRQPAMS